MQTFSEIIRNARLDKNYSMKRCADEIGISTVYWSDIENDNRKPFKEEVLSKVADMLEIDPIVLADAAVRARKSVEIRFENLDEEKTDLVIRFARILSDLSHSELQSIESILRKHNE